MALQTLSQLAQHPLAPIRFPDLITSPHGSNCWGDICINNCPFVCGDVIPFQILSEFDAELNLTYSVDGGTPVNIGPAALDSTNGLNGWFNYSIDTRLYPDMCEGQEVTFTLTASKPGVLPVSYQSAPICVTYQPEEICCSYEIRYESDCAFRDSMSGDVIYENGHYGYMRVCGNLYHNTITDVSRRSAFLSDGPSLCTVRARDDWEFLLHPSPNEMQYLMGLVWMHSSVQIRKYGEDNWIQFVPSNGGWVKGRQFLQTKDSFAGSGSLVLKQAYSISCC